MKLWIARRTGPGGAAGYARRLERGLRDGGHLVGSVEPGRLGGWPAGDGVRLALERVPFAHVYRAGGGVHAACREALGLRGPSARSAHDAWVARSARVVIANSRRVADDLIRRLGIPAARVELVRTGVDPSWTPGEPPQDGRIVLFAGHGWRRKGFRTAVRAFASVRSPRDRLWIAGRDARRGTHVRWARAMVPDVVDLGEDADLRPVLPSVSAVLQPTRYDPASNLVLEAMACGVPAVTTAFDGSAEVLPEGRLIASDPLDVAGIARALRFALDAGPGMRSTLVACALRWPDPRNIEAVAQIARRYTDG